MKPIILLALILFASITYTKAQRFSCGRPTCEEPGDPAIVSQNEKLKVYPNPSRGVVTVELGKTFPSNVTIVVTDASGKTVERESIKIDNSKRLDLSDRKSGIYLVTVQGEKWIETTKIMVEH